MLIFSIIWHENISHDVQTFTFGLSICVLQTVHVKKKVYDNIFDESMLYCTQVSKRMTHIFVHSLTEFINDVCLHFTAA